MISHTISYYWHRFLRWCKWRRKQLNGTGIKVGDYYEDCAYKPRVATKSTIDVISGMSLVPGDGIGNCCPWNCGAFKISKERAEWMMVHGPWDHNDNYELRQFHKKHNQKTWWKPIPEWLVEILAVPPRTFHVDETINCLRSTSIEELNNILAHVHWYIDRPLVTASIRMMALEYKEVLPNYKYFMSIYRPMSTK